MRKSLISLSLVFVVFSALAQRDKIDTVYYQGTEVVEPGQNFTTFEVCEVDRKARKSGECTTFNKNGLEVEKTNYSKDEKNGVYQRLFPSGGLMIEGAYSKGEKDGVWMSYNAEGQPLNLEFYEKGQAVISRALEIIPDLDSKDDVVVQVVEEQAKFPGGVQGWLRFLDANMEYPREAKTKGIQGDVYLKFLVTKEGLVVRPAVTESPSEILSEEALRILRICPNWIPKKVQGEPVDSYMEFRIAFRLG